MKINNLFLILIFILNTESAITFAQIRAGGDAVVRCISGNCKNGYSVVSYPNGDRYEGYIEDGVKKGQGTYIWAKGSKYVGNWKNDAADGTGVYYYDNGDRYEGQYENGTQNGYGILYFAKGNKYEGQVNNNKISGKGTFYYNSGPFKGKYVGEWFNDKRNGNGTRYYDNGDKFVGVYQDEERVSGTYYYANGDQYEGKMNDDNKRHGQGTLITKEREKQEGEWQNDNLFNGWITKLNGNKIKVENGVIDQVNPNDVTASILYLKSPNDLHNYAVQYFLTNNTDVARNVHWVFKGYSNVKSSTGSFEGDQYIIEHGQIEIVTFTQIDETQPWHVDPPALSW